ncbi:hypothetical protein K432DRAFT_429112 [Lepidopterella palustris CBS 459.81]|uniref:Uncharacterized protein n=1 Tax=Lepidopterella palustris CBS 459.81 TaxID=1314670 RepID=A0A8E2E244_9PEZI|nr:hypothetical protein K432DRAFT_429112 [Lepidopterella palustris CBS 459.81]
MSLYEVMSTTTSLRDLACGAGSILEGKTKVRTREDGTMLFEYPWTEERTNLVREFSKTKTEDVRRMLATSARAKIPKRRPDEPRPLPSVLILETGWLETMKNEVVVLISLQTPKDALKEAKLEVIGCREDNRRGETKLLPGSIILVFESVRFRTVPAGLPFVILAFPTAPLELGLAGQAEHGRVV